MSARPPARRTTHSPTARCSVLVLPSVRAGGAGDCGVTHSVHMQRQRPCWDLTGVDVSLPLAKHSPDCLTWPAYSLQGPSKSSRLLQQLAYKGIERSLRAIESSRGKLAVGDLDRLLERRCVSRQCLRVQILQRKVYVVAPQSQRCSDGDYISGGACSTFVRQRTDGVAASGGGTLGKWDKDYSPTHLQWHFAAGVNVSDCQVAIRDGDFNGAFTRLRLTTSLRLLEEAASAGVVNDTELVLCLQETPINAGGWCLRGAQPLMSMTTNEVAPLLAFPHWLPRFRDVDFAIWDDARHAGNEKSATREGQMAHSRLRKAVFRGGLYRLSVYSDRWREHGASKAVVTSENWQKVGRTALLHALATDPNGAGSLLDVHVSLGPYALQLGINESLQRAMSLPAAMSLADQQSRFRYVLNVEGHGGWADRLGKLLHSQMLVIAQDIAPRLWFESALQPGVTHLVTDANLLNVSAVIRWAQKHDAKALDMVRAARSAMEAVLSLDGIRWYVRELLASYQRRLLSYTPVRDERAVNFRCETSPPSEIQCRIPGTARRRKLARTRCFFANADDGTKRFDSLHQAAEALFARPRKTTSRASSHGAQNRALASLRKLMCDLDARTDAQTLRPSRWCFDFTNESDCHRHKVMGNGKACSNHRERACVWRPRLYEHGLDPSSFCPRAPRSPQPHHVPRSLKTSPPRSSHGPRSGRAGGACVAACGCASFCAMKEERNVEL
jgi:hypothetical protein